MRPTTLHVVTDDANPAAPQPWHALPMREDQAGELNRRIHGRAHRLADAISNLLEDIEQAANTNLHAALGYSTWQEWVADNVSQAHYGLTRDELNLLARLLSANSRTTRDECAGGTR